MVAGPDSEPVLLEVGRIGRPHGLRGEVTVDLLTNVASRLEAGAALRTATGELVVVAARPHQGRWLVHFEGFEDRTSAEGLRGTVLLAVSEGDPSDPEALFVHELVGSRVVDSAGDEHGTVVEVLANPASDLLVLDTGPLVPLTFVESMASGVIRLSSTTPDGLLDDAGPG